MHAGTFVLKHGLNFDIATMASKVTTQWSKSSQSVAFPNYTYTYEFQQNLLTSFPKNLFMSLKHVMNKLGNWGMPTGMKFPHGQRVKVPSGT